MAITILSIGILTLAKLFPLSLAVSNTAEQTTIAANLAQAEIESIFYTGYDNITTTAMIEIKHRLSNDSQNPFYNYQRQTQAQYVDNNLNTTTTNTGLKKITVTAYWNNRVLNREKSQVFTILINKN